MLCTTRFLESAAYIHISEKMQPVRNVKLHKLYSAENIANNDDLLIEILVRLPVKSLLRFKSVSKSWLSLLSSPGICRRLFPDPYLLSGLLQRNSFGHTDSDYLFISLKDKVDNNPAIRSLNFINHHLGIVILQSCNGLLLCASDLSPTIATPIPNYYIYNPTTRQHVTLSHPPHDPLPLVWNCEVGIRQIYGVSLAFDPAKSPHYKVVLVRSSEKWKDADIDDAYSLNQIEIYSSESRTWRLSGDPFIACRSAGFKRGVFCNGSILWINCWGPSLYFNVKEEQIREMPMPTVPEEWEHRRCLYFGESRHHLHLVEIYNGPTSQFEIYEMNKDYTGWSVKYHVNLDGVATAFPRMVRSDTDPESLYYYRFEIVCVARQENEEDSYVVFHVPGKIIHYNLKRNSFWNICDVPDPSDEGFHMDDVFQYVESFNFL